MVHPNFNRLDKAEEQLYYAKKAMHKSDNVHYEWRYREAKEERDRILEELKI